MQLTFVLPFLFWIIADAAEGGRGSFWHITDLHLDPNYNSDNGDRDHMCWMIPKPQRPDGVPGKFGDRNCDSPKALLLSAIDAMKQFGPSPDFIIWTGDDTTHVKDYFFSDDVVVDVISELTGMIRDAFPNTVVFPTLGNHDYSPKNDMPHGTNNIIQKLADVWSVWLDFEAYSDFKEAGHYFADLPNSNIRIVGLNTVPWFQWNEVTNNDLDAFDPSGLFLFFQGALEGAKTQGRKVFITGHIPPGMSEKHSSNPKNEYERNGEHQLQHRYNEKYLEIINKYHDVIKGQFFGHMHTDSFRVFLSPGTDDPISLALSAPPISPLKFGEEDTTNPAIRLVHYDTNSAEINEVSTFYLDLDSANEKGLAEWQFEYNMTSLLEIQRIDPPSLLQAAHKIKDGSRVFEGYYAANKVQWDREFSKCDTPCRMSHFCAITRQDHDQYIACRFGNASETVV